MYKSIKKKEAWLISLQPNNFKLEPTTVWSFPDRGSWATHSGKYRGNWSPYVPRNLILRYSNPGDWVLDQFMGSGTTLTSIRNPFQYLKQIYNSNVKQVQKFLHEMEMLQIYIL